MSHVKATFIDIHKYYNRNGVVYVVAPVHMVLVGHVTHTRALGK